MSPPQRSYHKPPEALANIAQAMFTPSSTCLLRGARTQPQGSDVSAAAWIMALRQTPSGKHQLIDFLVEWGLQGKILRITRYRVISYDASTKECILEYEAAELPVGEIARTLEGFALSAGLI